MNDAAFYYGLSSLHHSHSYHHHYYHHRTGATESSTTVAPDILNKSQGMEVGVNYPIVINERQPLLAEEDTMMLLNESITNLPFYGYNYLTWNETLSEIVQRVKEEAKVEGFAKTLGNVFFGIGNWIFGTSEKKKEWQDINWVDEEATTVSLVI